MLDFKGVSIGVQMCRICSYSVGNIIYSIINCYLLALLFFKNSNLIHKLSIQFIAWLMTACIDLNINMYVQKILQIVQL